MKIRTIILSSALVVLVALAASPTTTAHEANHGTIKVHDGPDAAPDQRNEPHVDCDFYVEGFNMDGSSGELVIYDWPPTGFMSEVLRDGWNGSLEADEDGFHFENGPYELESGHYRVEAFSDGGHPGDHGHFAKAKMFWTECAADDPPPTSGDCPPVALAATANGDGSIRLDATGLTGNATLLRDGEAIAQLDEADGSYLDSDTTVGTSYSYVLQVDGDACATVEVTSIPVFPSALAGIMAIAASALGYVVVRRR